MPLFAGRILLKEEVVEGWVEVEAGRIVGSGEGKPESKPTAKGWIVPAPVNSHTHVADAFLRSFPGKPGTVAELVGPGGWKQRHLAHADTGEVQRGIQRYVTEMAAVGTARFMDFREGGIEGVRLLAALTGAEAGATNGLAVEPIIYGRPKKPDFAADEAQSLLAKVHGIGLSALRDFPDAGDAESWADAARKARKPLALHVSEAKREPMEDILALGPAFLVHCTQATRGDLEAIADEDVPVVVCARSNAHYGLKTPVDRMLAAGVTLAVGTDNGMLHDGNLFAELAQIAAWYPKIPVADLLRMATWNGRRLAGLPMALPVKVGAAADLIVLPDVPWAMARSGKPGFEPKPILGSGADPVEPKANA